MRNELHCDCGTVTTFAEIIVSGTVNRFFAIDCENPRCGRAYHIEIKGDFPLRIQPDTDTDGR